MYTWLETTTGMRLPTAQTHTPASTPAAGGGSGGVYRVNTAPPAAPVNRGSPLPTGRLKPSFNADPFVSYQPGYEPSYSRLTPQSAANPAITPNRPAVSPARPPASTYANAQPVVNRAYTPGANYRPGGSGIAAKNAAAAAGATGAQAAAAARAAAPRVVSPAMAARGSLSGAPLIGAVMSGPVSAGFVKAAGGSWWEATGAGVGATVGTVLGQAGGAAAGAAATVNPAGVVVGSYAGGTAGGLAGAAFGRRIGGGLGRLPMARPVGAAVAGYLQGGAVGAAGRLFGNATYDGFLQGDDVAGPAIAQPEDGLPQPATNGLSWPANLGSFFHRPSGSNGIPTTICGKVLNPEIFFRADNNFFLSGNIQYQATPDAPIQTMTVWRNLNWNGPGGGVNITIASCNTPDYSTPGTNSQPPNRPTDRPQRALP